jgi:hypothetical protein
VLFGNKTKQAKQSKTKAKRNLCGGKLLLICGFWKQK